MRLDLAERLRCPYGHAPTPLVVVARETRDRDLREGFVGCPVCRREARIIAGHVRFDGLASAPECAATGAAPELERVIALLGLAEPEGAVLLTGRYAALAGALAAATGVSVIVMHSDAARASDGESGADVAAVHGSPAVVPFTDATFRGVALEAGLTPAFVVDAVRATAIGGRVLADISVAPPPGLKELARDDTEWVAAREAVGAIVELKRRI